jgi:hypothetical protein
VTIRRDRIPVTPPTVRRIEYDRDLRLLTPATLSGFQLASVSAVDGWSAAYTQVSGNALSAWDMDGGDLMDERGRVVCYVEVWRPSASPTNNFAHYAGLQAGFEGDNAGNGMVGCGLGRSPQFGSTARGYLEQVVWTRSGATMTSETLSGRNASIADSQGGEPAVAVIDIRTAPDGSAPPQASITVLRPIASPNPADDVLDWSTPSTDVEGPVQHGTTNLARGIVLAPTEPWGVGVTRVASGSPIVRPYVSLPASSTLSTGRARLLVELPRARSLRSWREANP